MPQRRKLTHPLLLAVPWVAFYVSVFGLLYGAYQIVYLRVELGTRQQRSIDALEANPASFVWYTVRDAASNPSYSTTTLTFHTARSTREAAPGNARRRRRRRPINYRPLAPDDRPPRHADTR